MERDVKIMADYLWDRSSSMVLRYDKLAFVTSANNYAQKLLGEKCIGRPISDLLVDFIHKPDVDHLFSQPGTPCMFNFSTPDGMPETLLVTCFSSENGGILIGEHDVTDVHEFRSSVLDLNQKLGNLTRELQKKNAELQQINEQVYHTGKSEEN
jgi:hypothetical protein